MSLPLPPQRVLLVTDNEDDSSIVRDLLANMAAQVEWVTTYDAAYAAFTHGQYDVCLLDYRLGDRTGLEFLQQLSGTSLIPIILLTSSEDYRVDVAAAQAGAADYLVKGLINAPLLERAIRYAIQRKASEAALLQAQRFAQATVDALPDNIAVLDEHGTIVAVNAAWRDFAQADGYVGADDGVGDNYLDVCDASDTAESRATATGIRAVMAGDLELFCLEYPCHSPYEERWYEVRVTRFASSGPLHVVVAHEDITARKQAEQDLEAKSREILTTWESMIDAFFSLDTQWRFTHINSQCAELLGRNRTELIGKYIWDEFPDSIGSLSHQEYERAMQQQVTVDFEEFYTRLNTWFEVHAYPSAAGLSVYFRDISERKQAEATLRESNEKFLQLVNNIEAVFWMRSPDMRELQYLSPAFERIWGRSMQSLYANADQWHEFIVPEDREYVVGIFSTLQRDAPSISCEYRIIQPDGGIRWVHTRGFQVRNDAGELVRLTGVVTDITERKLAEQALRESEARFSGAFENAPIGVALVSLDGRWLQVNQALCEVLGYPEAKLLTRTFQEITHPDDLEDDLENMQRLLAGEIRSYQMEKRYFHARGDLVSVLLSVSLVRSDEGQPLYFISQIQDITERKKADEALRDSEREFRTLAESMPQIVWITRADGWNTYFSQQWMAYTGLTLEESLGHGWNKPFHPDDQQRAKDAWEHATATLDTYSLECRLRRADGEYRWWLIRGVPLQDEAGQILKWFGTCTDIHDLKLAELGISRSNQEQRALAARLEQERAQLAEAQAMAKVGSWELDLSTNTLAWSDEVFRIFGIDKRQFGASYEAFLELIAPADRAAVNDAYTGSVSGHMPYVIEHRIQTADSSLKIVQERCQTFYDDAGRSLRSVGTVQDITERKEAEAALRAIQQRLALATEAANIGIWDWDVVANKLVWDARMYALYGIQEADFGGAYEAWRNGLHPEDRDRGDADMTAALEGSREFHTQFRVLWPDGTVRHIEAHAVVLRAGDGTAQNVVGVNWDITERKVAEAALVRMRDELEVRVQERTGELARLNDELRIQVAEREGAEAETRTRARQQEAVAELGQRALTDIEMDTLLQGAAALVAATLEVEISALLELMPDHDTLLIRAGSGWKKGVVGQLVPSTPDSQAGYALLHDTPVIVPDLRTESRFKPSPLLLAQSIMSGVTVVIRGYTRPFGILGAHTVRPRYFTRDDVNFLQSIANVLAAVVERKRIEAEIRQLNVQLVETNEQLRRENVERQMALGALSEATEVLRQAKEDAEQARESAEIANQAKSEFLSRMSHELRTPLNAILGYGQILEMRDYVPDIQEEVAAILKAGRHLLELINEVLDIARIEAGRLALSLEPVPLGATVLTALDLVRPIAAGRQVQLAQEDATRHATLYVFADQQRLRQVLVNLLSNAIKYNREGGQVVIAATIVPGATVKYGDSGEIECSGMIRLAVRDTGPGIALHHIPKLFMPFERLGAERTRIEGTGIGLSLCKRLVEAMHGAIGVESVPGEGSTFWVELPLLSAAPEIMPVAAETTALPHATLLEHELTILYIEDNITNFVLIKQALALWGHSIKLLAAEQGSIGLELARSHQPDLILLDLHLPNMMGDVVLQRLQAEPATRATRAIPVIMLSAEATPGQIDRLLAAGARAYLTKPLDLNHFFNVVEQVLDTKGH